MVKQRQPPLLTKCTFPGCTKLISSKYNLKRHIDFCHRGVRPHECSVCFKRFSSKQNKLEHIRMEHSYSQQPESTPFNSLEVEMSIPNLSFIVQKSLDPLIRPFAKVEKLYMFPEVLEDLSLPPIALQAQQDLKLPLLEKFNFR